MASAFLPAPFRCPFAGLRVESPDLNGPSPLPSPVPAPLPNATFWPLAPPCGDERGAQPSTLGRRAEVLGTRAGTPRRVPRACGALRRRQRAHARVPGVPGPAVGHPGVYLRHTADQGIVRSALPALRPGQGPQPGARPGASGTPQMHRPRRQGRLSQEGRALVSFASLPRKAAPKPCQGYCGCAVGEPGPVGAVHGWCCPRCWQGPGWHVVCVARGEERPAGVQAGTPRRQKQLRRTSSDVLEWDILTL